jgi:pimeloyl-ACP methyl ester carboxylesterase
MPARLAMPGGQLITHSRGFRVHYEVWGAGPALVLIHGHPMWGERWRDRGYVTALEGRYRVIIPDLVGYGDSDKPHDPSAYGAPAWASDVIAVLDAAGTEQAHVWGYSLGAWVAEQLAVTVPDRVVSLTLGGMPPGLDLDQRRERLGHEEVPATWEEMFEGWPAPVMELYKAHNDLDAIGAISPALYESATTISELQAAPHPTLAYIGGDEEYVDLARRQSEALPCGFEVVPGDHFAAFALSDNVVPLVIKHIETSSPASR